MPDDVTMRGERVDGRSFDHEPLSGSPTADEATARGWLDAGEGWIETHRELMPWRAGDAPPDGRVLAAELRVGDNASVEVRWDGRRWVGLRVTERDGDGAVLEESFLSTVPGRRMVYRTWWRRVERDGVHEFEACASRFAGWRDEP